MPKKSQRRVATKQGIKKQKSISYLFSSTTLRRGNLASQSDAKLIRASNYAEFLTLKLAGKKTKVIWDRLKCGEAIYNIKDSMQQVQERTAVAAPSLCIPLAVEQHYGACSSHLNPEHRGVTQRSPPNKRQRWYATDDPDFDVLQDLLLIYFYCQE